MLIHGKHTAHRPPCLLPLLLLRIPLPVIYGVPHPVEQMVTDPSHHLKAAVGVTLSHTQLLRLPPDLLLQQHHLGAPVEQGHVHRVLIEFDPLSSELCVQRIPIN